MYWQVLECSSKQQTCSHEETSWPSNTISWYLHTIIITTQQDKAEKQLTIIHQWSNLRCLEIHYLVNILSLANKVWDTLRNYKYSKKNTAAVNSDYGTYQEVWFILPHNSSFNIQPTYIVASLLLSLTWDTLIPGVLLLAYVHQGVFSCNSLLPLGASACRQPHIQQTAVIEKVESREEKERRWQRGKKVHVTLLQCEPAAKIGSAFFFPLVLI